MQWRIQDFDKGRHLYDTYDTEKSILSTMKPPLLFKKLAKGEGAALWRLPLDPHCYDAGSIWTRGGGHSQETLGYHACSCLSKTPPFTGISRRF